MTLQTTLQQLYDLPLSNTIRENVNAFPVIESLHVLAATLVFGTILIVDLRLLGVTAHRPGARKLIAELLPFTWGGFALAVVTGSLLFISNALSYVANEQFLLKMVALMVAGLNMAWFHSTAYRRIDQWDETMPPPMAARVAGALSLLTWMTVIALARWIGFTLEMVF
ncbi:MAG: hypothetical protein P8Y58_03050 [Novosphingobium sp.]